MKITDRLQQHWLGWVITIGAITASVTWLVATEVLVKPRDFEISRLKEDITDLKQQVTSLKSVVNHETQIKGFVSDPKEKVYLLVRPKNLSEFWIQPPADVSDDGSWTAYIYFGLPEKAIEHSYYQVYAIAGPKAELHEGTALHELPPSLGISQPIEIQYR